MSTAITRPALPDRVREHGGRVALTAADLEHPRALGDLPLLDERAAEARLARCSSGLAA